MPIIHLHGRLGYLPWQSTKEIIPFGSANIDPLAMTVMMNQIKVVHEDITDGRDKEFDRAKQLLKDAERVYLLGFGFGGRNVERLGLGNLQAPVYAGSAYELSGKESNEQKELLGGKIELHNVVAAGFLKNIAVLN
jgi:hypothetical protein